MLDIEMYLTIKTEIENRIYDIVRLVNKVVDDLYFDFPKSVDTYDVSFNITEETIDITFKEIGKCFHIINTYIPLEVFMSGDATIIKHYTALNEAAKTCFLINLYTTENNI